MKTTYENELRSLQNWINNVNNGLAYGMPVVINSVSVDKLIHDNQPNLPFDAAILKDHIVICQEGGKIELVSLCEKMLVTNEMRCYVS